MGGCNGGCDCVKGVCNGADVLGLVFRGLLCGWVVQAKELAVGAVVWHDWYDDAVLG